MSELIDPNPDFGREAPAPRPNKKIRKQTMVWVDHNGKQIRVCDMHDKHLVGTLRLLRRAGQIWKAIKITSLVSKQESEVSEAAKELDNLANSSWRDHVPAPDIFEAMCKDSARRGIIWERDEQRIHPDSDASERLTTDIRELMRLFNPGHSDNAARSTRQVEF